MELLKYIFLTTIIFSISYSLWIIAFKKSGNFVFQRLTLLTIVMLSFILPFSKHNISAHFLKDEQKVLQIQPAANKIEISDQFNFSQNHQISDEIIAQQYTSKFLLIMQWTYLSVGLLLLIKIFIGLTVIFILYKNSEKRKEGKYIYVFHKKQNIFSFFNLIFLPKTISISKNLPDILIHEKAHADQYHSIDVVISEILSCVFWFNPLVWHFKSQMKLIHEYLADETVIRNGRDIAEYQKGLINQLEDYQQFILGSNYFYSTKKRIMMMSKTKTRKIGFFQYLGFIHLFSISFLLVGFINAHEEKNTDKSSFIFEQAIQNSGHENPTDHFKEEKLQSGKNKFNVVKTNLGYLIKPTEDSLIKKPMITAIELPKMNVLYIGVENPIKIAVAGIDYTDLDVSIDKGNIVGGNGEYIVKVFEPGIAILKISHKGVVLDEKKFRVKRIPNPYIASGEDCNVYSGRISKEEVLKWGTIEFIYKYLDLDYNIQPIFFGIIIVSIEDGERMDPVQAVSYTKYYTERQVELIKNLKSGDYLYIENLIVLDGHFSPIMAGQASIVID